ncbi:hypothetical protein Efla_007321 [Eimeria flavescens]
MFFFWRVGPLIEVAVRQNGINAILRLNNFFRMLQYTCGARAGAWLTPSGGDVGILPELRRSQNDAPPPPFYDLAATRSESYQYLAVAPALLGCRLLAKQQQQKVRQALAKQDADDAQEVDALGERLVAFLKALLPQHLTGVFFRRRLQRGATCGVRGKSGE